MQCPKCGCSNPDDAVKCSSCAAELRPQPQPTQGMPQQPQPPQQPYAQQPYAPGTIPSVPDYLVWSIVVTVLSLFCWPLPVPVAFGIVAIVKSSQAKNRKMLGDYFGALQGANAAKTWLYWAVGLNAALLVVIILFVSIIIIVYGAGRR